MSSISGKPAGGGEDKAVQSAAVAQSAEVENQKQDSSISGAAMLASVLIGTSASTETFLAPVPLPNAETLSSTLASTDPLLAGNTAQANQVYSDTQSSKEASGEEDEVQMEMQNQSQDLTVNKDKEGSSGGSAGGDRSGEQGSGGQQGGQGGSGEQRGQSSSASTADSGGSDEVEALKTGIGTQASSLQDQAIGNVSDTSAKIGDLKAETKTASTQQAPTSTKSEEGDTSDIDTTEDGVLPGINQIGMSPAGQSYEAFIQSIEAYTKAKISLIDSMSDSSEMSALAAEVSFDQQIEAAEANADIKRLEASKSFVNAMSSFGQLGVTGTMAGYSYSQSTPAQLQTKQIQATQANLTPTNPNPNAAALRAQNQPAADLDADIQLIKENKPIPNDADGTRTTAAKNEIKAREDAAVLEADASRGTELQGAEQKLAAANIDADTEGGPITEDGRAIALKRDVATVERAPQVAKDRQIIDKADRIIRDQPDPARRTPENNAIAREALTIPQDRRAAARALPDNDPGLVSLRGAEARSRVTPQNVASIKDPSSTTPEAQSYQRAVKLEANAERAAILAAPTPEAREDLIARGTAEEQAGKRAQFEIDSRNQARAEALGENPGNPIPEGYPPSSASRAWQKVNERSDANALAQDAKIPQGRRDAAMTDGARADADTLRGNNQDEIDAIKQNPGRLEAAQDRITIDQATDIRNNHQRMQGVQNFEARQLLADRQTLKAGGEIQGPRADERRVAAQAENDIDTLKENGTINPIDPNTGEPKLTQDEATRRTQEAANRMSDDEITNVKAKGNRVVEEMKVPGGRLDSELHTRDTKTWQKIQALAPLYQSVQSMAGYIYDTEIAVLTSLAGELSASAELMRSSKDMLQGVYQSTKEQQSGLSQSISAAVQAQQALSSSQKV